MAHKKVYMESLKRIYFSLTAGLANLTKSSKHRLEVTNDDTVTNRVSRDVNYYRNHFFNL